MEKIAVQLNGFFFILVKFQKTNNKWLHSKLGISKGYIITGINDTKIETIEDISKLKEKYGDDILENIEKLEYLNRNLEKKEVIFR